MAASTDNMEPLARAICERLFRRAGIPEDELKVDVERLWHCVAAQIEARLMDEDGNPVVHELEAGVDAYVDWRKRHPDYVVPPQVCR